MNYNNKIIYKEIIDTLKNNIKEFRRQDNCNWKSFDFSFYYDCSRMKLTFSSNFDDNFFIDSYECEELYDLYNLLEGNSMPKEVYFDEDELEESELYNKLQKIKDVFDCH